MGKLGVAALLFAFLTIPANANVLTWDLVGVTFSDGTAVTGSFQFDADTGGGTASAWNISVSTSPAFPTELTAFTYTPTSGADAVVLGDTGISFFNTAFTRELDLVFASALTDAGGTISLNTTASSEQFNPPNPSIVRTIASGSITTVTSAAPEPASILLTSGVLLGILGIAARRRRVIRIS